MADQKRPNVVLIMTDNQPADLLGCYGNAGLVLNGKRALWIVNY